MTTVWITGTRLVPVLSEDADGEVESSIGP